MDVELTYGTDALSKVELPSPTAGYLPRNSILTSLPASSMMDPLPVNFTLLTLFVPANHSFNTISGAASDPLVVLLELPWRRVMRVTQSDTYG